MNSLFCSAAEQHPPLPTIHHDEPQRNSPSELGESRHSHSAMSDEERNEATFRAARLADFFQAESDCFDALYARTGCFSHKGAADGAKLNARKAGELLAALIVGARAA